MRRITVGAFLSLDGVMQAPGGPQEDPTGEFRHGGWTVPYWDDALAATMGEAFSRPFDLLLGRRTYDIFAAHWPHIQTDPQGSGYDPGEAEAAMVFNRATKYVATHFPETLAWQNSEALGPEIAARLTALRQTDGPDLIVQGSSVLVHQLLAHDLVDEMRLLIYPLVLGKGKRLFNEAAVPTAFRLTQSRSSPSGVLIAAYERAGEIETGSFALETPSAEELERRSRMS